MRSYPFAVGALVAVLLGTTSAAAQSAPPVAITPFVSLNTLGTSPVGAAFTFPVTPAFSIETDIAVRPGNRRGQALSSNASLLRYLPRLGRSLPYAAVGAGVEQYGTPVFLQSGSPIGTRSQIGLMVSAGGGFRTPMNDKMDLWTDMRWYRSVNRPERSSEDVRFGFGVSLKLGQR